MVFIVRVVRLQLHEGILLEYCLVDNRLYVAEEVNKEEEDSIASLGHYSSLSF